MRNLKNTLMVIMSAIGAFLLFVIQSKNKKIEKQQDQIKQQQSKNEELDFINKKNQEAKHEKNTINSSTESDVDRMLEQTGSYRDRL